MFHLFFGDQAPWFTGPALIGSGLFLVRLLMLSLGAGADIDGHDAGSGADHHAHGGEGVKFFSVQTVMAFVMGFGWAGLIGYRGLQWGIPASIGMGLLGGAIMMWVMAIMLRGMLELQSSGNIHAGSTVGLEGSVYVAVPPTGKGTGQVMLVVDGRQRTFNAVSAEDELIRSTRVRVMGVNGDNTLTVARAV